MSIVEPISSEKRRWKVYATYNVPKGSGNRIAALVAQNAEVDLS